MFICQGKCDGTKHAIEKPKQHTTKSEKIQPKEEKKLREMIVSLCDVL